MQFIQTVKSASTKFYDSGLLRKLYLLIGMLWAIPIAVMTRLITPVLIIRTGSLLCQYIGHYAGDTEVYMSERKAKINTPEGRYIDLWFHANRVICNDQLEKMWRKKLVILPRLLLAPLHKINTKFSASGKYIAKSAFHDRDINNVLDVQPPSLSFSEQDRKRGQEFLLQLGVPEKSPFICLLIRDQAYHKKMEFTNYRNANINNFFPALDELTTRGIYVIRMGKRVTSKLNTPNKMIIDYAGSPYRNDFMDIYLGAYCSFVISTSSGWDMVASTLFRRPVLYTNMVPVSQIMTWTTRNTFMLKRHWSTIKNRYLTLSEIFDVIDKEHKSISPQFLAKGVELVENSPDEIKNAVIELADQLAIWGEQKNDNDSKQEIFWKIFKENIIKYGLTRYHGNMQAKISGSFLDAAPEFLS